MTIYHKIYPLWGPLGKTNGKTPPTIPQMAVKSSTGTQDAPIFNLKLYKNWKIKKLKSFKMFKCQKTDGEK